MKVLLSWLREFAPFDGDPVALGDVMSQLGMAVEELTHIGANLDGIVVARVLELRKHPDADKIQLVDVDLGDGNPLQICCGAFNMAVGDLVPLATLGTVMPNGLEIARRKLRGQWSNGMLCSARELELADDHGGIYILDPALAPGTPLTDALGIERDVLYDLDLTGNRPDALSVAGVARDLAAKLKLPFALPPIDVEESGASAQGRATVTIVDGDLCGRFVARLLDHITVGASPKKIASRLALCGMRPINNVVDASNYVMLELGQPSHTFDLAKLANGAATPGIRVRRARAGETLVTLDDVERRLEAGELVICDQDDRAVGIAGVMGGANTEIDAASSSVLLEMAWFDSESIGRTARRLGLRSEASIRFERGTSHEHIERCALRFAELLGESGATLAPGLIDARGDLPAPRVVRVRPARINELLGTGLAATDMAALLEPIGFAVAPIGEMLDVTVPAFRPDTATETDVAEEVARQHGYDRIAVAELSAARAGALSPAQVARRRLRHLLADAGASEAMPMPFLAPGDLERAGLSGDGLVLTNPLAAEESVLRTSLRPGLLKAVGYNASHRASGVTLFEIGHVYGRRSEPAPLPDEHERVAVIVGGADAPVAVDWLERIATHFGLEVRLVGADHPGLHATRTASVTDAAGAVLGVVGEIDPEVLAAHGIDERVAYLDLATAPIYAAAESVPRYRPVSRFPSSDIDLAFEVADTCAAGEVERVLRDAGGETLAEVWLFDVFRGAALAPGTRSLAFTLRFQAPDRTLTDDEIGARRSAAIAAVEQALPAKLRG